MEKLRIIFDQDKCIGAGMCALEDPSHFRMVNDKAELINGERDKKNVFHLDLHPESAEDHEHIIVAGQSCPVNAIGVVNLHTGKELVTMELKTSDMKEIAAEYDDVKEWRMDPLGYFLIRVDHEKNVIEIGHCRDRNIVNVKIVGSDATFMFNTIIRNKLVGTFQHAAYLGKELQKAEIALKEHLEYVQDDPLDLKKKR